MRKHRIRALLGIGFGAFGTTVAVTGLAWACTAQAPVDVRPATAPPGAGITVDGGSSPGSVEIRWDSAEGPLLATAPAENGFAVGVRVPDAAPGVHTVVAVVRGDDGRVLSRGNVAFEVTAPGGTPAATMAGVNQWQSGARAADQVVASSSRAGLSQLSLGVGLLAVGLVALAGGFAAAGVRRRRVLAYSDADR